MNKEKNKYITRREKFDGKWSKENDLCKTCIHSTCKRQGSTSITCESCSEGCLTTCVSKPEKNEDTCKFYIKKEV